jgi:membrane protein
MGRARAAVVHFWRKAYEDNLTGLASMVAYNLLLSIFPLALVALWVAGRVLRSHELQQSVLVDLKQVFPSAAESTLSSAIERLQQSSTTVGIIAIAASIWFAASFWGALDTAFCRIYHRACRSWVRQKLFGLVMFSVVLLFIVASVAVPALQSLLALCITYAVVPSGRMPWRCVWPGAVGATAAIAILDYAFPLYLAHVSTLRLGTTFVFVLIALVWFYALSLILLSGAVINELRFERR